jgi:ketosteroid isomerase-like protein
MTKWILAAAAASCALLGACQKAEAPTAAAAAITEADAAKAADATAAVWSSMDAAKIKALYAPSVVAFDFAKPTLSTDRAAFDKTQDDFAAAKIDKLVQQERSIQVLDADTFVVSGTWAGTSSTTPASDGLFRCTDVYQKDAAGAWLIVNEHCSAPPKTA